MTCCRLLLLLSLLALPGFAAADSARAPFQLEEVHLQAEHWIDRLPHRDRPLLSAAQVSAFNAALLREDASMHDLAALPGQFSGAQVRSRIAALSARPTRTLYDAHGTQLDPVRLDALQQSLALDAIAAEVAPRYALVVQRADLRTFPTTLQVFSSRDDHDIDRFQESALYPGAPVAVLHASADGQWLFVVAGNYAAWLQADHVAFGARETVLDYAQRQPRLIVTGASARTAFTPEQPALSSLALDMGVSVPLLDWPPDQPVNGQLPIAARVVQLPVRAADGALQLLPALLPRSADAATAPLPATRANLLRQAFKFLGERYGWGNRYDARDCSGFVSDVYRSLGIVLPRNTGDQARSPLLQPVDYRADAPRAQREQALAALRAGDLVYIPGHVMMVIGHEHGHTWVIHDVQGAGYRDAAGQLQRALLNGVSVTPLEPLLLGDGTPFIDHITRIQRIPSQGSR